MLELCLAPILLTGFVSAVEIHSNVSSHTKSQGAIVEVLSCKTGLGVGAKATTIGLYAIEAHYGFTKDFERYQVSVLPKLGISATDYHVKELPQGVQFSLGLQTLVSYERVNLSLEYWHMSNGSALGLALTNQPNIGLDLISLQVGYSF